jgi:hypothetical protein
VLVVLAPQRSIEVEDGAVEIRYMGRSGPIQGAMEDAIREFERLSRERHAVDPANYPIYRVISGQDASRGQTEDPTRFLVSLAGGTPPDVIDFDRFAISEWASRGAFTPLDDQRPTQTTQPGTAWQRDTNDFPPGRAPPMNRRAPKAAAASLPSRPFVQENFFPGCWDEAVYRNPRDGSGRPVRHSVRRRQPRAALQQGYPDPPRLHQRPRRGAAPAHLGGTGNHGGAR